MSTSTSTKHLSTSTSTSSCPRVRVQFHILLLSINHSVIITPLLHMWNNKDYISQGLNVYTALDASATVTVDAHLKTRNLQPQHQLTRIMAGVDPGFTEEGGGGGDNDLRMRDGHLGKVSKGAWVPPPLRKSLVSGRGLHAKWCYYFFISPSCSCTRNDNLLWRSPLHSK